MFGILVLSADQLLETAGCSLSKIQKTGIRGSDTPGFLTNTEKKFDTAKTISDQVKILLQIPLFRDFRIFSDTQYCDIVLSNLTSIIFTHHGSASSFSLRERGQGTVEYTGAIDLLSGFRSTAPRLIKEEISANRTM